MRIVLDTNVLVRAFVSPTGPAAEVLHHIRSPHALVASDHLLQELSRVLLYRHVQSLHGMGPSDIQDWMSALAAGAILVAQPTTLTTPIVHSDPDDDQVIAAAIGGRADVLCTLDKHLRERRVVGFCAQFGIRVLTDVELLSELRTL